MKMIMTPTQISEEFRKQKIVEIQRKLQQAEAQKARKLLAIAMTHFEALKFVRKQLEEKAMNGFYDFQHRLFKD